MSAASSFFFLSPLSLQSTKKDMEAFLVPDKWIRVRPNSHRDSVKTDDRPLKPHFSFVCVVFHHGEIGGIVYGVKGHDEGEELAGKKE